MAIQRILLIFFALGLINACSSTPSSEALTKESTVKTNPSADNQSTQAQPKGETTPTKQVKETQPSAPKPSTPIAEPEDPLKQIKIKAYLNNQSMIELEIQNTAAQQAEGIVIGFRLRYSARIVSNMTYDVTQSIKPGQTIIVDTKLPLPTQRSIILAQVIKAKFKP